MPPGFSLINVIIILGLIYLAYFGYTGYLDKKVREELTPTINSLKTATPQPVGKTNFLPANQSQTTKAAKETATTPAPTPPVATPLVTIPTVTTPPTTTTTPPTPESNQTTPPAFPAGYYRNETYFYEISFPSSWPVKVRSAENISFGTVPPKNGQGAITIEVTSGGANEIQQAKAEAKKYPGLISLEEETANLAGVTADKITLINYTAKSTTVYYSFKKNGHDFIVSYSQESAAFTQTVNQALTTFKFYK